jgi:hypothetical protein
MRKWGQTKGNGDELMKAWNKRASDDIARAAIGTGRVVNFGVK